MKLNKLFAVFLLSAVILFPSLAFSQGKFAYVYSISSDSFNPLKGEESKIVIYTVETVNIQIRIYDAKDRLVREYRKYTNLKEGYHTYSWDGRTAEGKAVTPGVYRFNITYEGVNEAYVYTEDQFVNIVEEKVYDIPTIPESIITAPGGPSPFNVKVSGISRTRVESGDYATREDDIYERFNMDITADYGSNVSANADLEYQSSPIAGAKELDINSAFISHAYGNLKTELFYKRYTGFYDTPLRLFASYRADRDRAGVKMNLDMKRTAIEGMYHKLNDSPVDESGGMLRVERNVASGLKMGLSSVNRFTSDALDYCVGIDGMLDLGRLTVKGEFAQAKEDQLDVSDNAWRAEVEIPFNCLTLGGAYQDIGEDFISYYSDVPHGSDTKGYESSVSLRPVHKGNFIRSSNYTVSYESMNNHFENDEQNTLSGRVHLLFYKDVSTLVSYTYNDMETSDTNSLFVTLGMRPLAKLYTNFRLINLDNDIYSNTSFRGRGEYDLSQGWTGISQLEFSKRKVTIVNEEQEYDLLSVVGGAEKEITENLVAYGHIRFTDGEDLTETSIFLKMDYNVLSYITASASYGSFTAYEQQERFFGEMQVKF